MNKIKLNQLEIEVESYNKNTYFSNGTISSSGSCSVNTNDMTALTELAKNSINTIQIYNNDDVLIYDLQNANANIDNIGEYLNGDRMNININFTFNYSSAQPEEEPTT